MEYINGYIIDDDDIAFEYELQSTPQNMLTWKRYIETWKNQVKGDKRSVRHVFWLYERFCNQFHQDPEVWQEYIQWVIDTGKMHYLKIDAMYRRAFESCKRNCDTLCLQYMKFATGQFDLTLIRKALVTSLQKIAKENQFKIWYSVLEFVNKCLLPLMEETLVDDEEDQCEQFRVLLRHSLSDDKDSNKNIVKNAWLSQLYERYLTVCPPEKLSGVLMHLGRTNNYEIIKQLYDKFLFKSNEGNDIRPSETTPFSLCLLYLNALEGMKLELQYEIFFEEVLKLHNRALVQLLIVLVKHYIKSSQINKIEPLLNNIISSTTLFHEFASIYNICIDFEEATLATIMDIYEDNPSKDIPDLESEIQKHMNTLTVLSSSYEMKLNDFYLRKNVNNVQYWLERIELQDSLEAKLEVFQDAILRVDPVKVTVPKVFGKLWCSYAEIYWDSKYYDTSREIYEMALKVPFPFIEDLELIWATWTRNELRIFGIERAIFLLRTALKLPKSPENLIEKFKKGKGKVPSQTVIFNSLQLWTLFIDLAEVQCSTISFADEKLVAELINTYEKAIALKIVTPIMFVQYAQLLQKVGKIRESFQIYERAISSFPSVVQYELWTLYLQQACITENDLSKEHIRDLFDQATALTEDEIDCRPIFILYNEFEERNEGVTKRSLDILLEGARKISDKFVKSKIQMWDLCIMKATSSSRTELLRAIYAECIQVLPRREVSRYVIDFAQFEVSLGETTRPREILTYGASLVAPALNKELWDYREQFELQFGDKEKYKNMLVLKQRLEVSMKIDTEEATKQKGNIEFVMSKKQIQHSSNPEEIELDI
ncbi:hypothetical protein KAFR_0E03350 [Kazachstania africana CBS 2517]|uniref:Pre-mRNA-splicing factor SYF1 n=1 Tax=Kazachstania africana (strain ATCC 22294 / BCRC 22015 / CBS 2517 / CECT 1963 / NBRC 1671 / NRRL Y-8276) TaxID=1071382 RepID=H2AVT7_KAZAF|nr:hypothetical protein KAFR_0E03350 [Kazachstania africana CBS 2517]CCF58487.1 hypothetical protein KAFR_0E03350 [Kazachstania africana CBS 2517]